MIVDSSALLAILNREPEAGLFQDAIVTTSPCRMSVANVLEASIVVESLGGTEAGQELDAYLEHAEIEPVPVSTLRRRGGPGSGSAEAGIRRG